MVYVPAKAPAVVYRPRYNPPAYKPVYKPAYAPAPARQLHSQQRPHIGPAAAAAPDHYHPHHHGSAVYQRPKPQQKAPAARRPHPGYAGGPPAYPDYAPVGRGPAFDPRNPAYFARIQEQDKEIPEDAIDLFEGQSENFFGKERGVDPDSQVEKIEKLIDNS